MRERRAGPASLRTQPLFTVFLPGRGDDRRLAAQRRELGMTAKMLAVLAVAAATASVAVTATAAAGAPRAVAGTPAHRTYEPELDPADFVRVIDNPYFPLP